MRLYVIRHAESEGNAAGIHQFKQARLSTTGQRQAKALIRRLPKAEIDLILSSPLTRAKETAKIISRDLGCQISFSDLLIAIRRPSDILGKDMNDPQALKIKNLIDRNWGKQGYRYSDEETFAELRARGEKILAMMEKTPKKNVVLIAHGAITRMLVSLIVLGKHLKPKHHLMFSERLKTNNAGIATFEFDEKKGWSILTWNA